MNGTEVVVRGERFLLCEAGLSLLARHNWCPVRPGKRKHIYLQRSVKTATGRTTVFFHREILGLGRGRERIVDHINRDTRDNRLSNLRAVTYYENAHNRRLKRGGAALAKPGWFRSDINRFGRHTHLGTFRDAASASAIYKRAAEILDSGRPLDVALLRMEMGL